MIETKESFVNLKEILKNKDLDMIYVGPYDLSISYGVKPNRVFEDRNMLNVYEEILMLAKKNKKKVAIHCSGSDVGRFFLKKGYDMVTISTDLNLLNKAIIQEINDLTKRDK